MIATPHFHNSMACFTGNIVNVSSKVYIDSVKSDKSHIVSEEIETTGDSKILRRVSAAGEINEAYCLLDDRVAPFSPVNMTKPVERSQNLPDDSLPAVSPVPLLENVLSDTNSTQASVSESLSKDSRVIRKILFLRPNEDTEVAKAKILQDLITSVEKEAARDIEKRVVLAKETIVELVILKAPIRQKPKTVVTDSLVDSKLPLPGNGSSQGLDTVPISLLRSDCRTPSPTERETGFPSEIKDVEHQNCYFDSQILSLRHTSLACNEVKSAEDPAMNWTDGFYDTGAKFIAQDAMNSFDRDSRISVTSSRENRADSELSEDAISAKSISDVSEEQIKPLYSVVKDQIYSCMNTHPGKGNQRKEGEGRPPFSYSQLIKMALSTRADKKMALREIYQWIENNFSYYRYHKKPGWKNSIRHSLSLGDVFIRKKVKCPGQFGASYWTLDPDRLLAKDASCRTGSNFSEVTAVPNGSKNVDLMPNTTNPVVGKRRAWSECKQQSKQMKHCRLLNTAIVSKEGFTADFDVAANLKCNSQSDDADRHLLKTETAAISADSTTAEVLAVRCASELLHCHSDRGARRPDISGPKVCRRRKQKLKVLCTPPEMDDYDQLNFDEEVTPTDGGSIEDTEPGKSLVSDDVFWMEIPDSDEPILTSMVDEEDVSSLLFIPSKASDCRHQNVLWTTPVRDHLSPAAFDVSLPVSPFGFKSGLAATDFDGVYDGRTPAQIASEGFFFNVHSMPKWLSDCYGEGYLSAADDKLESQMFCSLLSEEISSMDDEPNPEFIDSLFSFSHCL